VFSPLLNSLQIKSFSFANLKQRGRRVDVCERYRWVYIETGWRQRYRQGNEAGYMYLVSRERFIRAWMRVDYSCTSCQSKSYKSGIPT
jgi:hypothetical protein